jgi:hypothetical protein
MQDYQYRRSSKLSTSRLKLIKPNDDIRLGPPLPAPKVRVGGALPDDEMGIGRYLVDCQTAWLKHVSPHSRRRTLAIQVRIAEGKYAGVGLRGWITDAIDESGTVPRAGKYARWCEVALGRPLEDGDPVGRPEEIFTGHRFVVDVGWRGTERRGGGGRQAPELARYRKDEDDFLRVLEILSREDL